MEIASRGYGQAEVHTSRSLGLVRHPQLTHLVGTGLSIICPPRHEKHGPQTRQALGDAHCMIIRNFHQSGALICSCEDATMYSTASRNFKPSESTICHV